jgi:hypothetical protein
MSEIANGFGETQNNQPAPAFGWRGRSWVVFAREFFPQAL